MKTSTPPPLSAHPGLTVRVYTVDPKTKQVTSDTGHIAIPPAHTPMQMSHWPPCRCPWHPSGSSDGR